MGATSPTAGAYEVAARDRLQILFRMLIATAFLIVVVVIQLSDSHFSLRYDFRPLYVLVALVYAFAGACAFAIQRVRTLEGVQRVFVVQLGGDLGVITGLVYVTGGGDSLFSFLYPLWILAASASLSRRGVVMTAALAAIAYGLVLELSFYAAIPVYSPELVGGLELSTRELLFKVTTNTVAFFLTAVLASHLAGQLRKAGEVLREQQVDLRKLQALHQHIVENIQSGLLTVDRDGWIMSFNRAAEEIMGFPSAAVLGENIRDFFPALALRLEEGFGRTFPREEEVYSRGPGQEAILGLSMTPLRDSLGEVIGTIVIFQDLTQLREMEDRLKRDERLAAVGRLAASIAHEIRNPLASMSGSIQLLQSDLRLTGENAHLMDIILRETDRLNKLIGDLLHYVRPEQLRRNAFDVAVVARETLAAVSGQPGAGQIAFHLDAPPDGVRVWGDAEKLRQVFYNLLINATQAMTAGGRCVVQIRRDRDAPLTGPGSVQIEISDTGSGIRPEDVGRVFDLFFTTKERGTGLGLPMVHKIVEAHGGYIEVESQVGKGTTFRLTLPPLPVESVQGVAHV